MNSGFKTNSQIFHTILDSLREGVNVIDSQGTILYANKSSADYVNAEMTEMVGQHITKYYQKAALLEVLETHKPVYDKKIIHDKERVFIVNAIPLFLNGEFSGGVATFRDITEIERLSRRLESLEMELALSKMQDVFTTIIGKDGSLHDAITKAKRSIASLGGPRHCVIVGETGTGKTMLAKAMYNFAEKMGVIKAGAPFIEVNCAQFTNSDIAAMEVFGTEKGSFTGAGEKPGLVEIANGGILFLDEAHALGNYQTMLLKIIESGIVRRIGGRKEREVDVLIITASSKNLKEEFIPELYQRLAQYQIELPSLGARSLKEKEQLFDFFLESYKKTVKSRYGVNLKILFHPQAKNILLQARYERNIRQFRDVINVAVDGAAPLVSATIADNKEMVIKVGLEHLPYSMFDGDDFAGAEFNSEPGLMVDDLIKDLNGKGLGPRKIAKELKKRGIKLEYYQIAYKLKKYKKEEQLF